jgi:hypothetical protein
MAITTAKFTVEWEQFVYNALFVSNTQYSAFFSAGIQLCLLSDVSAIALTGANAKQNFLANELVDSSYTRTAYVLGTGSYDGTNKRVSGAITPAAITPSATLTFNGLCLIYGGRSLKPATITPNISPDTFSLTGHSLSDSEEVVVFSVGGDNPTGVGSGVYYAKSVDANTFEIYSDVGLTTKVTFTDAGSGTIKLGYAKGVIMAFGIADSTQTILSTQTSTVNSNLALLNSGYVAGV